MKIADLKVGKKYNIGANTVGEFLGVTEGEPRFKAEGKHPFLENEEGEVLFSSNDDWCYTEAK